MNLRLSQDSLTKLAESIVVETNPISRTIRLAGDPDDLVGLLSKLVPQVGLEPTKPAF
jgi:hypothetical protein